MKAKLIPFDIERYKDNDFVKVQTRDGVPVVILTVDVPLRPEPIVGYFTTSGHSFVTCWRSDGKVAYSINNNHQDDLVMLVENVQEPTPLTIPWEFVNPIWKWAAMYSDGKVCFYTCEPVWKNDIDEWYNSNYAYASILNIDTTGINPELSLTKRPE